MRDVRPAAVAGLFYPGSPSELAATVRGCLSEARRPAEACAGVPKALTEIITLGRTLKKRAADVLAYFDRPHTSNGPTEAVNGRLEHLRGTALGFRNLTHYIARSLLETGGFRTKITNGVHPRL